MVSGGSVSVMGRALRVTLGLGAEEKFEWSDHKIPRHCYLYYNLPRPLSGVSHVPG